MSFKSYMKNGKNDVIKKKGASNSKHIKDPKTMELAKIDQGPKEPIDLLHLLKNMKWKNRELNSAEFSNTNKPENNEPKKVTRQIISHDLMGKKNHTAFVKAPLLRKNNVINRKIPEPKPKIIAPKVQINRPSAPPQSPIQKFTKPQKNPAMTKAQLEFSKRNSKKLPSLNILAKINGPNACRTQSQNQELADTQNEIAKVQAELEFLANNPDYIPETDVNDEKPIISELNPPLQSENQELSKTLTEIAKVQAELEFLKNNPDYIPETNECIPKAPKKNDLITSKNIEPKVLKSNPKKTVTNSSQVPLKSKQVTKTPPTKQSNSPKLNSKNKIGSTLTDEYPEIADNRNTLKDNQKLREAETKVAETKTKLALMKNYTQILLQKEYNEEANTLTEQPDTQKIAEAKTNVAETKSQLEILEDKQEESFEDYRKRMQKCNQRRKSNTLDTIIEEESEVFEDGCEEQEDLTEAEEITEEKVSEEKLEVADEEECETLNEEECETLGEEEREEADEEECEEADEETQDVNEEESEDSQNTELCTTVSENESKLENNNPEKFDTKIPAQQKRQLLDILKNINWGKMEKPNESVELQEVQCAESTDNEEVVESSEIQSDSLKKHNIKFNNLEIQPFGTKEADSVLPEASKEDIITSFFKTQSSHEEEMVSESEKSLLKFRMLQEELLESSSVATSKTEQVHIKSSSENEPEKSHPSEDGSFSSFFEVKPLIKPKHKMQNNPPEPVSDQSKSPSETKKESKKSAVHDETTLKDLPSTNESNLEQSNGDESILEGLKIQSNMKTDQKTVELSTHKIINVAPCETASEIVIRPMELEYSEDFESDSSDKPTNTKVCDFTSDSCTEKEESLKIESVHMSEDCSSKGSKQSFICHLYKVKIRIKSINWRGSGNMEAVTLSFYNPFTKENAAVKRKFVLPYFYTADFYCYVSYISPPNMLDSSLACYPPVILISKRKSVAELARGALNLNKEQTNVQLTNNGKIMGDIMLSAKILDYGPLGDKDDSSNEIIEIVFKETKNKEIKIASPSDVDKTLQKKTKHLIVEEISSSGNNTSSDLPPDQLFKKRPFRYKRKTKSKGTERFRRYTSEASFLALSSISIQTDKIEKQKSFINNCKDIQTDVQEEDVHRKKSKSKMIQTESEMDSKHTTARLQCESKITQTEATSEKQQIISNGKNKLPKKYETVVTNEKLTQSSIRDDRKENSKTESVTVENPKNLKKVSSEPLKHRKRTEEIFSESVEIKSVKLEQNKSSRPKKSKAMKLKAFDLAEECTAKETPEAVHQYLQGKRLAERFFKVCTERKPPQFDKMTYEEQKLYKCNYVKQLRDALPSDFVTPPSIKTKEKDLSERRWMSHMAAFLHKKKAMSSDGSSTSVDKTGDQVPEIQSEVASPDVLINNPDYQAMKKYYHPELCKADVMTSTSYPSVRPSTTECGVQTSERVIRNFAAQTKQEKLPPLLSKISKKLSNKTSELQTCLVIVDTIPSARNGSEKLINKNILYEKVCESEKFKDRKTKDVKKSSKTVKLSKSNVQLESYPEQCADAMPNKNLVKNLQIELQDFVKNIKLELHILKHRAQYTPNSNFQQHKNTSREITDFDKLVNSFTSLVGRSDEHDFNAVYSELQQLQDLVYNRIKKFSEEHLGETDFHSKTKQIKDVDNYVSQDKELKLIFNNPKMDQAPEKRSHDNNYRQKPSRS